jgi:hypothetical protein
MIQRRYAERSPGAVDPVSRFWCEGCNLRANQSVLLICRRQTPGRILGSSVCSSGALHLIFIIRVFAQTTFPTCFLSSRRRIVVDIPLSMLGPLSDALSSSRGREAIPPTIVSGTNCVRATIEEYGVNKSCEDVNILQLRPGRHFSRSDSKHF